MYQEKIIAKRTHDPVIEVLLARKKSTNYSTIPITEIPQLCKFNNIHLVTLSDNNFVQFEFRHNKSVKISSMFCGVTQQAWFCMILF